MKRGLKPFSDEDKELLLAYWEDVIVAADKYFEEISRIEVKLMEELGIEVEVFHVDGEAVGYGDYNREYKLFDVWSHLRQENRDNYGD
jgi:hypothetical protein